MARALKHGGLRPTLAFLALLACALPAGAQVPGAFVPTDETPDDFPDHPGREEAFYGCTACHGFKIVAQQGQTRRQWDDTIDFMIEKHTRAKPDDAERKVILDYLEAAFPPRAPAARGWQNPFLNR